MEALIAGCLSALEFGELQQHGNMAVLPLFPKSNGGPEYLTLAQALEQRVLRVTEISQSGSVPELQVANQADVCVLILDGEELAGAKQNRVLNTTILLKEKSEMVIPVTCTEQGRWSYSSAEFRDSGVLAAHRLRSSSSASVARSLAATQRHTSNQGEAWDQIARLSTESGVRSSTGAMRDVYEAKTAELNDYVKAFPVSPGQRGILVLVNGRPAGLDLLSRETAYATLHTKLIKSYALDAILQPKSDAQKPSREQAAEFLKHAALAEEQQYDSVGHGRDYRYKGADVVGSALVWQQTVVHLAFFAAAESEGSLASSGRRRGFRS